MHTKYLIWFFLVLFLFLISGCAQVELAIKVNEDATIPKTRIAVLVNDYTVFGQLKNVALSEYQKLPPEEREFVEIQTKQDAPPYIVAWVWSFEDQKKAQDFTQQFLGSSAELTKDQDLVILRAILKGEELEQALNKMGAGKAKPFLNSITLILKAYMPGEVLSYIEGGVEGKVWTQEFNLGKVYKEKPTVDIEVISKDR
ncbi:MAG: hypothetical protein ACUVQZ_00200 [Candidatus Caldatribacteriaceae bacterium]